MKMTTERLAELEGPISAYEQSESVEKRCIASAFRALLVNLEEATEDIEHWKDLAKGRKDSIEELRAELAATRKQLSGCTRSHPHENMSPMCELRTEIARLNNQLAHKDAELSDLRKLLETPERNDGGYGTGNAPSRL